MFHDVLLFYLFYSLVFAPKEEVTGEIPRAQSCVAFCSTVLTLNIEADGHSYWVLEVYLLGI